MNQPEQQPITPLPRQGTPAGQESRSQSPDEPVSRPARIPRQPPPRAFVIAAHLLILFAIANAAARLLDRWPGFHAFFALVNDAGYLPLTASIVAGMHDQRGLIILILTLTLLFGWPFTIATLPHLVIPIAIGLLIGMGLAKVFREGAGT